ncbi:MAG: anti-sigma factor antagonist [Clostridiales bacterium]|uniref:Anti-sigma factor antagonist n=1 Tax=Candidatus Scybalenecus merdavium TaxID=2840939 RepID=A0A9D1MVW2_9FIRM|nr:anti-sigma factor antagonist [Clostridiales bacterium]HIU69644.1 anti-sigma factor antagonist [Candidatus Scubalenecus merdavium]
MGVTIKSAGDTLVVYLSGEIDHHSAVPIRQKIDDVITVNKPKYLILDFKGVSFMDSSGIGLVMGRYRTLLSCHGQLEIRNVSHQTKKVMELAGLSSIATIKEKSNEV